MSAPQTIIVTDAGFAPALDREIAAFDDSGLRAVKRDRHDAFGGSAVSLLGRLRQTFCTQPIDGRFEVAVVLGERLLAIHHANAGFFAQVLDQRSGDFRHVLLLRLLSSDT